MTVITLTVQQPWQLLNFVTEHIEKIIPSPLFRALSLLTWQLKRHPACMIVLLGHPQRFCFGKLFENYYSPDQITSGSD